VVRKLADTIHLRLRFDERLRRRIEKAAEQNNQSMNAEIIARLEQSFAKEDIEAVIEKTALATVRRLLEEGSGALDAAEIERRRQASIAANESDPMMSELRKAIRRIEFEQKPGTDIKRKSTKEG
jgi:SpoVK/Ycf46/Vps4 family AAA+-type ATPase